MALTDVAIVLPERLLRKGVNLQVRPLAVVMTSNLSSTAKLWEWYIWQHVFVAYNMWARLNVSLKDA